MDIQLEQQVEGERAVAYVRVSTERAGMISPELQMIAIAEHCTRYGYQIVEMIEDIDESGRFWKRRQAERAVTMIESGIADVLVVARWSRLARNRLHWAIAVDRVESVGGRLESAIEPVDTSTPTGRFTRGMLGELAAFESDRIAEQWREVRRRRLAQGLPGAGCRARFGYEVVEGRYRPHPVAGPLLRRMYLRYIAGDSFHAIASRLNRIDGTALPGWPNTAGRTWNINTVSGRLDVGFAAGLLHTKTGFYPGAHPAVISMREWQAYCDARQSRRKAERRPLDRDTALMLGLVWCTCGREMPPHRARWNKTTVALHACRNHLGRRFGRSIGAPALDPVIRSWVQRVATDRDAGLLARTQQHAACERRWADARQLSTALQANASCIGAAASAQLADRIAEAERDAAWIDPVDRCRALAEDWDALTIPQRRARLHEVIRRVVIHLDGPNRVEVQAHWQPEHPEIEIGELGVDPLDGCAATRVVQFGLRGVDYEIALDDWNTNALRDIMQPLIAAARPVTQSDRLTPPGDPLPG